MAERQFRTLTKRTVDRLSVNGKDAVFWDYDLPGFGVRVYPSGKKVFVVQTRAFGRSKRVSLGTHGDTDFSVDHARKKATDIIARIKTGQPPVPPAPAPDPTVADLAGRYEREYVAMHCKPLTISHYRLMLRKHIVPAPGDQLASTHAAAAIRLLVLTGCRRNEILGLRWDDLNFDTGEMRLPDTKTGTRMVPLTPAVARVFDGLSRTPGNQWVFPGRKKGARLVNLNDSWDRVRKHAGLEDVRLHDLRHSFASRALALGEGLPMIGDLLGHRMVTTTARYAHLARDSVRHATANVGDDLGPRLAPPDGR